MIRAKTSHICNLLFHFEVRKFEVVEDLLDIAAVEPVVVDGDDILQIGDLMKPIRGHENYVSAFLHKFDVPDFLPAIRLLQIGNSFDQVELTQARGFNIYDASNFTLDVFRFLRRKEDPFFGANDVGGPTVRPENVFVKGCKGAFGADVDKPEIRDMLTIVRYILFLLFTIALKSLFQTRKRLQRKGKK